MSKTPWYWVSDSSRAKWAERERDRYKEALTKITNARPVCDCLAHTVASDALTGEQ